MSTNPLTTPLIDLQDIHKTYRVGPVSVPVVNGVSLRIWQGEFVAITGASGSGKSTLLNILGLLDTPDSGSYFLDGRSVSALSDNECTLLRNRKIGFIFQSSPMLPRLSAEKNVMLPLLYRGTSIREAGVAARAALARVGLAAMNHNLPSQLSVGQQQRVAIARALVTKPRLILADEPTASLDDENANAVLELLQDLHRETNATILLITHELADAAKAARHFELAGGKIREARHTAPVT